MKAAMNNTSHGTLSAAKLEKVKALAERGIDGEKQAAQRILDRYGISLNPAPKATARVWRDCNGKSAEDIALEAIERISRQLQDAIDKMQVSTDKINRMRAKWEAELGKL